MQCAPGTYSDNGVEPCLPCPVGTYQPGSGKTSCLPCPGQESTHGTGASSDAFCGGERYLPLNFTIRFFFFTRMSQNCNQAELQLDTLNFYLPFGIRTGDVLTLYLKVHMK